MTGGKQMVAVTKMNSDKNIEIIKQFYSGLNQNDLESALKLFDQNVIRLEFEGSPGGGRFKGLAELSKNFVSGRSTWAEGSCKPIDFISNGSRVVVTAHVKVRLKNETKWIDAYVYDGFAIKENLITEFHSFTSKEKAFAWAEISAQEF